MIRIKVDGVTDLHEARICAAAGADYIGFEQDEASPRYVPPAVVREITGWVAGPEAVGSFGQAPAEAVIAACEAAGFHIAQVESDVETCAAIQAAGVGVIRSFTIRHDASSEQLRALFAPFADVARYLRLDTSQTSMWGGEGESLQWRVVRELAGEFDLFLAGAPGPDHFEDVLRMRPYAVDVEAAVRDEEGAIDPGRLGELRDRLNRAAPR